MAEKTIEVVLRARDETGAAFQSASARVKKFGTEAGVSSGGGGLAGMADKLRGGMGADIRTLVKGGAVGMAAGFIAREFEQATAAIREQVEQVQLGEKTWGEAWVTLGHGIPIIGNLSKGFENLASTVMGWGVAAAEAKRSTDAIVAALTSLDAAKRGRGGPGDAIERERRDALAELGKQQAADPHGAGLAGRQAAEKEIEARAAEKRQKLIDDEAKAAKEAADVRWKEEYEAGKELYELRQKQRKAEEDEAKRHAESMLQLESELRQKQLKAAGDDLGAEIERIRESYSRRKAATTDAAERAWLEKMRLLDEEAAAEEDAQRRRDEMQEAANEARQQREAHEANLRADTAERYRSKAGMLGRSGTVAAGVVTPWAFGALEEAGRKTEQEDVTLQKELVKEAQAQTAALQEVLELWRKFPELLLVG